MEFVGSPRIYSNGLRIVNLGNCIKFGLIHCKRTTRSVVFGDVAQSMVLIHSVQHLNR